MGLVIIQLSIPFFLSENIWIFFLVTYFIGTIISHALFLAIHEITHDLAYKKTSWNRWLAILANLPLAFPFAMAFQTYHGKHHWHQGKVGIDTDLPSKIERRIFKGFVGKFFWMTSQILFYALRPLMILPLRPDKWQIANFIFQLSFMVVYFYFASWIGLFYLILSLFFAGGLHPISAHFVAEHYIFKKGQETYSYYGWMNKLTLNVGYHNEHHDFPNIPGSRLPKVRKIASKYYDGLYSHRSWTTVLIRFISDPAISLHSRVRRANK